MTQFFPAITTVNHPREKTVEDAIRRNEEGGKTSFNVAAVVLY
jgi:hypothetical protein